MRPHDSTREGRPLTKAGPTETVTATGTLSHARVTHGTVTKAELAAWLRLDRVDFQAGWVDGYCAGYQSGYDVGYGAHAEHEARYWRALARRLTEPRAPYLTEPHGPVYVAALARRGGREYVGGPVDWYTGRPVEQLGAAR